MQNDLQKPHTRIVSIDRFRGFIVFCMVFFIGAGEFPCLGILSRVANNGVDPIMLMPGMSLADIVDPIFLFLISLSYGSSFMRRLGKLGTKKTYGHFLVRYTTFVGIGSIMVSAEYLAVKHTKDPFYIQTLLMYAAAVLLVVLIVTSLIKSIPVRVKSIAKTAFFGVVIVLGIIGIVLAVYDEVVIFSGDPEKAFKHWSILHEIGVAGLLTLPFIHLSLRGKIIGWASVACGYTAFQLIGGVKEKIAEIVLGGILGTVGWMLIMLGGSVMAELYEKDKKHIGFWVACGAISVLALVTCLYLPMKTRAVTINYVLFCLAAASVLFGIINLFNNFKSRIAFFEWWGRNPMLMFLIGLLVRGIQKIWDPSPDTPLYIAVLFLFGSVAAMSFIAYRLYKKEIYIKL